MSKSKRGGGCGCKGIKGALPPTPEEGEAEADYMSRCQKEGYTEEDCQQRYDEETAEEQEEEGEPPQPAARRRVSIRMTGTDTAEVLLYGVIGSDMFGDGISARDFRSQIKALSARSINLRVNSPGGDVIEGAAMMAALDEFRGEVIVDVDGLAASAASVVVMAGDRIRMGSNSLMMIHNPMTITIGGAADHRATADLLDKVRDQIIDAYRRHSSSTKKQLADMMDAETWLTPEEAVAIGLAHEKTAPVRVAALADFAGLFARFGYRHPPKVVEDATARAWEETRRRAQIAARL